MSSGSVAHILRKVNTGNAVAETLFRVVRIFEANEVQHLVIGGMGVAL